MSVHLYLAPAAAGKTRYVLNLVRDAASGLEGSPRVLLPSHLQVRAWRRRLAQAGGAIGVRLLTFDRLYAECLGAAGEIYTELSEPVQYRLIRGIVDDLPLLHYAPLKTRPGFIQLLGRFIAELKAARVWPEALARAVADLGDEPRLRELAHVYAVYQERLQARGWADRAGLGWLALEALQERAPAVARGWPLVVVDGFDDLTSVQLALLQALADRVGRLVVTLTGEAGGSPRPLAHRRFAKTRQRLEQALGVQAEDLPERASGQAPALAHLEAHLFRAKAQQTQAAGALDLVEVPERAGEVRAALRWLKARLVQEGMGAGEVALLARSIANYRPFITQTAAEFGLPLRLVDGLPLRANPAVAALLDLLRLFLPSGSAAPEPATPRRSVVEAWRSPYFDWSALPQEGAAEPIGILPEDADALDAAARKGRVIGGLEQWLEALDRSDAPPAQDETSSGQSLPAHGSRVDLAAKFRRFVQRLTPPPGERSYREFVGWLEALMGPDPTLETPRYPLPEEPMALQVVAQARDAPEAVAERDVAALQAFKDVLRGLVWAEEALDTGARVDFPRFFDELVGAVDVTVYFLPVHSDREEILVADVIQARGVPFRAVAVLGLAEGEFPTTLGEDPLLRETDRECLRERFGLALEPSTESAEAQFFYEAVARPRERLLLTRPRLADNGAPWQVSPFWEEVRRWVDVAPVTLTSESIPLPDHVASWPELMENLAARPGFSSLRDWVARAAPGRVAALGEATSLFHLRSRPTADSGALGLHDGDLTVMGEEFARRFGPRRMWSASRLESYHSCPFQFFVRYVLDLEPREEPAEGLDARHLGNIYHAILEGVYEHPGVSDPSDVGQLLAALPLVAARVLDAAPEEMGFRETAWWAQTRAEILENARRSVEALAEIPGDFVPYRHEAAFGIGDRPELVVRDGDDSFRLCGFIDRVDRAPDGRVRIIDYKTSSPYAFTPKAVADGKKLQLPLYALGARDALGLGEPVEGFYWHVRHAEASGFTLHKFGPGTAMQTCVEHAWAAIRNVRRGHFVPQPPSDGCPAYCPAVGLCWHYRSGYGG